ncbi:putative polygalacturonase [Trifolium repens]|nr:putative polygalacturonase [Trifolium repens]
MLPCPKLKNPIKHTAFLTDFGAVGDGKTSNTKAFEYAIRNLSQYANDGGALLVVPPGKWLTGSCNLTSHFTLFLQNHAVILGSQDESEWPSFPVLPSYGKGRDAPNGRFSSLIFGTNLTDVVITTFNGTIDGQGSYWWNKFHKDELKLTRPYLIEIIDIIIQGLNIIAPIDSPNTDGIDPDSCSNVKIEDCQIISGDDCVAIKSGWDNYGIQFGMPSQHIVIRRLKCISPDSAMIALGSEMSGSYGSHPNPNFDPKALPNITGINYSNVIAENVTYSARLPNITDICISNVTIHTVGKKLQ